MSFSLAALMAFYTGSEIRDGVLIGHRGQQEYNIMDDADVLEFFAEESGKPSAEFVQKFLSNTKFFGEDLTRYEGLGDLVAADLDLIREKGMRAALEAVTA